MSDDDVRRVEDQGGSLLARISNEFVTMQKEYWGLGPVQAKSYMMDDLLLIVMRGGMTRAERTMIDFGQHDLVRGFRQAFEIWVLHLSAVGLVGVASGVESWSRLPGLLRGPA